LCSEVSADVNHVLPQPLNTLYEVRVGGAGNIKLSQCEVQPETAPAQMEQNGTSEPVST